MSPSIANFVGSTEAPKVKIDHDTDAGMYQVSYADPYAGVNYSVKFYYGGKMTQAEALIAATQAAGTMMVQFEADLAF